MKGKVILIGWLLSLLILTTFFIFIIAPLVRINFLENTYFLGLIIFPLYSIVFLGPFLLIYVAFRFSEYKKQNFFYSLLFHLIAFSIYYLIVGFYFSKEAIFSLNEYSDLILKLAIYFSFHILMMKFLINKFKLE